MSELQKAVDRLDRAGRKLAAAEAKYERAKEKYIARSTDLAILRHTMRTEPPPVEAMPASVPIMLPRSDRGTRSTVAKNLGLSYQHVSEVACGRRVSATVTAAIAAEYERRGLNDGQPAVDELRRMQQLLPNYSEIARRTGVTPQHVRRVFMGLSTSAHIMAEIQADIATRMQAHDKISEEVAA